MTTLNSNTSVILIILIIELIYTFMLFSNGNFLAGGDNYSYLQIRGGNLNPYLWDNYIPFGGRAFTIPNLLGLRLYAQAMSFIDPSLSQKILIFSLYFFKAIGFIKLANLISHRVSLFTALPTVLLLTFNAFASLNPFTQFPLMYGVYLPFSLYFFIKIYESQQINSLPIAKITLLSVIFSSLNSNPALSITIFIPQVLYILINIREFNKTKLINLSYYAFTYILINLWWALPLLNYYSESAKSVIEQSNWFVVTGVGNLYQNFRFIGQWGWYSSHFLYRYYPYSSYYDHPLIITATYLIIALAFFESLRRSRRTKNNKFKSFLLLLSLISILLVSGAREPFGFLYKFLFNTIPGFKIFREPFTKFSELYVLSICLLFFLFLKRTETHLKGRKKFVVFLIFMILIGLAIKPSITSENVWSKWNGSSRTMRVKIPEYWKDLEKYSNENLRNARILTLPKASYGTGWNWKNGFSSADDVAINFLYNGNNVLRNPLPISSSFSESAIQNFFDTLNNPHITNRYLSILGIDYVLQENDLDWRYAGPKAFPPTTVNKIIEELALEKVKDFGKFSDKSLFDIPNKDPDKFLNEELYFELKDKPALSLYKVNDSVRTSKFYVPTNLINAVGELNSIPYIASLNNSSNRVGILIHTFNSEQIINKNRFQYMASGVRKRPLFSVENLDWEDGWAWPAWTSINPSSWKYYLVRVKESLSKSLKKDPIEKIDLLIWLSAKRFSEINLYNTSDTIKKKLASKYLTEVNEAIDILKDIPENERDKDYWGVVGKLIMYMRRFNYEISTSNSITQDLYDNSKDIHDSFLIWVNNVANPMCDRYCYDVEVPESGEYKIYVDRKEINKLIDLDIQVDIRTLKDPAFLDITTFNNPEASNIWYELGKTDLNKNTLYKLNLRLGQTPNLLDGSSWDTPSSYFSEQDNIELFAQFMVPNINKLAKTSGFETLEAKEKIKFSEDSIMYKVIDDWNAGQEYELSFEHSVGNGKLGISLIESTIPGVDKINDRPLGNKVLAHMIFDSRCRNYYTRETNCWNKFTKTIKASKTSKSAYLFIYAYTDGDDFIDVKVRNISIRQVINPKVILKKISDNKTNNPTPKIKFKKINPTKYRINVSESKDPYILVFSESYNKDWKIYKTSRRDNYDYYNSQRDTFLDSDTFETWGMKPIPEEKHFLINGYANAWYIDNTITNETEYDLIVEFEPQKKFYILLLVSFSTTLLTLIYIFLNFLNQLRFKTKTNYNNKR